METGNDNPSHRKTIGLSVELHYELRVEAARRRSTIIDLIKRSLHAYMAMPTDGTPLPGGMSRDETQAVNDLLVILRGADTSTKTLLLTTITAVRSNLR